MDPLDYNQKRPGTYTSTDLAVIQQRFITKVYGWMSLALVLTGLTSYYVASSEAILNFVFGNKFVFFGLLIGELIMVGTLSGLINKMSAATATTVFIIYSILNGLTLSFIFLIYTQGSIASTFFICAGTFGAMSALGYFTKKDLTSFGHYMMMGLVGLIIASIVNIFLKSNMLMWITTVLGVLIFTGLTAYDTQKIKNMSVALEDGSEAQSKGAIMGALSLYLDFINLFLMLLRLFGNRR